LGSEKLNESNKIKLRRLIEILKPIQVEDHYTTEDWKIQREVFKELKKSVEGTISEAQGLCTRRPPVLMKTPLPKLEDINKDELKEIFEAMQSSKHIIPAWLAKRKEFVTWMKNRRNALKVLEEDSKFRPNDMQLIIVANRYKALLESVDDDISIFKKYYHGALFSEKKKNKVSKVETEMELAIASL
jgi:hypothetical protein